MAMWVSQDGFGLGNGHGALIGETLGLAPILIIDKSRARTCPFVYLSRSPAPSLVLNYWKSDKFVKVSVSRLNARDSRSCPGLVQLLVFKKSLYWTRPFVNFLSHGLVTKLNS